MVSGNNSVGYGLGAATLTALRGTGVSRVSSVNRVNQANAAGARLITDSASFSTAVSGSFGLRDIDAALVNPIRISNTLSTASDAIYTIKDMLKQINDSLIASTGTGDTSATQSQINASLSEIQKLTSNTSFSGRKLFDGHFSTSINGQSLTIDKLSLATLGSESQSLESIASGQENDLSHGTETATVIVHIAMDQVAAASSSISHFRQSAVAPVLSAGTTALDDMIKSPLIDDASTARTNSVLIRAQLALNFAPLKGSSEISQGAVLKTIV